MLIERHKHGKRFSSVVLGNATLRLSASKRGDSATIRIASDSRDNPRDYSYSLTFADDAEILQLAAWLNRYVVKMAGLGVGTPAVRWQ